jgi:tetratricopeptide (TPR) repeat protein
VNDSSWARVRSILDRALELDTSARDAFVAAACDEPSLRAEVEACLAHDDGDDGDAAWCAIAARVRATALADAAAGPPARVGRYTIVRELAAGGMGVVYEAVQDEPRRHVALKVLRGSFGSGASFLRFEREAKVLALLDHPVIARIHEAGTHVDSNAGVSARLSYIAMELVPGARDVVSHARAVNATRDQCIDLMLPVCDAVGFAHEHGVVHRDLKPSNVLVGADGRVRVIDFGIARMFDDPSMTRSGELLGTLRSMSPEQLDGPLDRVGPPSDVYALGLILHELVLGRSPSPAAGASLAECIAQRRRLPARPRSLDPTLSKDLESILLKALDPDPARRYPTASRLAQDLRALRCGEPITARDQGPFERMWRLAALHRVEVAWIAAFVVVLIAGSITSTWGWWRATVAREDARRAQLDAESHGEDAVAVAAFLGDVFAGASPREGRIDITVRDAMERAAPWIDERFADRPGVRATLHLRFADVFSDLGVPARAIEHYEAAADAIEDAPTSNARDRCMVTQRLARALLDSGAIAEARATAESVAGDWRGGTRPTGIDELLARDIVAQCLRLQQRYDEAVVLHRQLVHLAEEGGFDAEVVDLLRGSCAVALRRQGATSDAIALLQNMSRLRGKEQPAPDEPDTSALVEWTNLAMALIDAGEFHRAERILGIVYPQQVLLLGHGHPAPRMTLGALAFAIASAGRIENARALYARAIDAARAVGDERQVTLLRTNLSALLLRLRQFADAEREAAEAVASARAAADDALRLEATPLLGRALGEQGKFVEAAAATEECVALSRAVLGPDARTTMIMRYNHARMLASCGRRLESKALVEALLADPAVDRETRELATEALGELNEALARTDAPSASGSR